MQLCALDIRSSDFPPIETALSDPDGLLAWGGDLSPERLINAYRHGIFPWYSRGDPILWWSPSERGVFFPEKFKPSRSLRKFQRKTQYEMTFDKATSRIIRLCASTRKPDETWITDEMSEAYIFLAEQGWCHSVEVWHRGQLVGGLYGLIIGEIFCGESMFSLSDNASKVALWWLCEHFSKAGGKLIDCQMMNPHLASLGAEPLPRDEFQILLKKWRDIKITAEHS